MLKDRSVRRLRATGLDKGGLGCSDLSFKVSEGQKHKFGLSTGERDQKFKVASS